MLGERGAQRRHRMWYTHAAALHPFPHPMHFHLDAHLYPLSYPLTDGKCVFLSSVSPRRGWLSLLSTVGWSEAQGMTWACDWCLKWGQGSLVEVGSQSVGSAAVSR